MPTVPVYGGPKVQSSAGPSNLGINTTQAPQGGFNGEAATNQLLDAGQKLFQKAQADADQVAAMEADKKLTELQTKLLYEPGSGAFNKRGKDAFGSVETVNDELEKARASIDAGLTTDRQKKAFNQSYQQNYDQINRQLNQHVAVEIQKYDSAETESYVSNLRNLAIANPYDTDNLTIIKEKQARAIYDHANRNGMPAEWAQQKLTEAVSTTNLAVLNQQVAGGDDLAAEQYFKDNKETFFGDDQIRATRIVEEGSTLGKSMREGDRIFQSTGSLTQAMSMAKEIENPKVRQATESRLGHLFSQKKQAQQDFEERTNIGATNFIDSGGTWQDYARQNPGRWAQLPSSNKNAIMGYRQGGAPETDFVKYYDLKTLAANNPEQFKKIDLSKTFAFLANGERKEMIGIQTELRNNQKPKGLDGFQADSAIVNAALAGMGIDSSAKGSNDDIVKTASFRRQVDEQLIAHQEATGRKANNNEVRKIVDDLSIKTVVGKKWFGLRDDARFVFETDDTSKPQFQITDIPKPDRQKIDAALKARNIPQTDDNALSLWIQKINKNTGKKFGAN